MRKFQIDPELKRLLILVVTMIVIALACWKADAEGSAKVNPMLAVTYEMNSGSDKYIRVRQIPGCEDMTMDEIDAAYNEFKAEMKRQETLAAEAKAKRAKMNVAKTNSKAATIAKMVRENPFNLRVLRNFDINVNKNFQWPTDYICMSDWDPYNVAWQRNAK